MAQSVHVLASSSPSFTLECLDGPFTLPYVYLNVA